MNNALSDSDLKEFAEKFKSLKTEIAKVVVGQDEIVDQLLLALFAKGHCLLEGVPGLAKTLLISTLAKCLSLDFNRIQFTPDLMPGDITGTEIIEHDRKESSQSFKFIKGPIFTQILLADEINRTPPKTQAALLEAMQEGKVTAVGTTYQLAKPFFVLATQNPIEQEGTYPLPEAQLDRFMFNLTLDYPSYEEEVEIVKRTTQGFAAEVSAVLNENDVLRMQQMVREIAVPSNVLEYAVKIVGTTRPTDEKAPDITKSYLSWGAGPRASQNLILGAKAKALSEGRASISREDVEAMSKPVLRHRIIMNYTAEAEGLTVDTIIDRLVRSNA
jgi:MoxR-like ATPase